MLASLEINQSGKRGFSGSIRTRNYCEDRHSGRADFQLTDNFVVAPWCRAGYLEDFESSPIGQFLDYHAVGIQIEDRVASRKRLMEGGAPGCGNGPVELFAVEVK